MADFDPRAIGVTEKDEVREDRTRIHVKKPSEKFGDFLKGPNFGWTLAGLGVFGLILPGLMELLFLPLYFLYRFNRSQPLILPFRLPQSSGLRDQHQPHPGHGGPMPGEGIGYYGIEDDGDPTQGRELWFSNSDERAHTLVFGTTGAGKTEALLSFLSNSLVQGSGALFVDGKGDVATAYKLFSLVRRMGREDDFLAINYMTGGADIWEQSTAGAVDMTNTTNPLAFGSSSSLSELIVSLMSSGESGGNGDMFAKRAQTFVSSLVRVLCYMRDQGEIQLSMNKFRQYLELTQVLKLANREDIPRDVLGGIHNYLQTLPGMTQEIIDSEELPKDARSKQTILDQHGFIAMQLTQVANLLSDDYGHIFGVKRGHVDFYDVVVNRRVLIVLLPALEKSEDNMGNLGKVIVAALKGMMGSTLGDKLRGGGYEVLDARVTNSPSAFRTILDELGYYMVPGIAVIPAQARSLGFGMIFAGQDYPAFKKKAKEEADSVTANTSIKIAMKVEDPTETLDIFQKRAGKAKINKVSGHQRNKGRWDDADNASIEEVDRLNLRELTSLNPGEAYILFGDFKARAKLFFVDPSGPRQAPEIRLNEFLGIDPPDPEEINALVAPPTGVLKGLRPEDGDPPFGPESTPLDGPDKTLTAFTAALRAARRQGAESLAAGMAVGTTLVRMNGNALYRELLGEDDSGQSGSGGGSGGGPRSELEPSEAALPEEAPDADDLLGEIMESMAVSSGNDAAEEAEEEQVLSSEEVARQSGEGGGNEQTTDEERAALREKMRARREERRARRARGEAISKTVLDRPSEEGGEGEQTGESFEKDLIRMESALQGGEAGDEQQGSIEERVRSARGAIDDMLTYPSKPDQAPDPASNSDELSDLLAQVKSHVDQERSRQGGGLTEDDSEGVTQTQG